jgi:general secretion pathway protein B
MSYILDALRKADRDRALGEVPDLETAHWGVRRPERTWRWLWIVVVLLVFNAGLLVYMLNRNNESPEIASKIAAPEDMQTAQTAEVARPEALEIVTETQEFSRTPAKTSRPRVAVQPQVMQVPATAPQIPIPAARVVTATEPLTDSSGTDVPGLPEWGDLPLELRSQFVLPRIDVYVYADEPQRRFVLMDLKKYREGDALASGVVLEKIHPGYIQLNYQGTRFRFDR